MAKVWVLVAASLVGNSGCTSCNMMFAPGGVQVEFMAESWAPGVYTVEMLGASGDVTLPDPADGTNNHSQDLTIHMTDDDEGLRMMYILQADPPPIVEIVLSLDGVEFQRTDVAPVYQTGEPNGDGCGEATYGDAILFVETP